MAVTKPQLFASYSRSGFWSRHSKLLLILLIASSAIYGFLFALGTTYVLMQLLIPLVAAAAMTIALLPESGRTHLKLQEGLVFAFVVLLLCWPDYIAIALPGMPWITVVRLTTVPLALVFLLNISQSADFRSQLKAVIGVAPSVTICLLLVTLLAAVSIAFSVQTSYSMNKWIVLLLSGTLIFFVSAFVFSRPGRAIKLAWTLWGVTLLICLIALRERQHEVIPWAGHIPSFLKIDPLTSQQIFTSKARAATGVYRVQSKFTTPLSLAEFLAMSWPFLLHFAITGTRWTVRIAAVATLALMTFVIVLTDARLGFVGLFVTLLLYLLAWGTLRWKRDRKSVFGPAIVLGYPVLALCFVAGTFMIGRLRALVWGTGAQQASTDGRADQLASGIPMVLSHPWGYGIGRAAETLGYRDDDLVTIDSYYLSIALELGIVGFILYYATFLLGIWQGAKASLVQDDENGAWIVPIAIALVNFVVIKSVLSQQENHPFAFLLLGAAVGMTYQIKRGSTAEANLTG